MANRKMKISPLAWKMKKNHRRLTCHARIAFLSASPRPEPWFQLSSLLSWNAFFSNFASCAKGKYVGVYFGRLAVTAMCLELRHKDIRVGESLKVTLRQVGRRQAMRNRRATLNGLERCSRMADYERSRRQFPQLFYKIQFRSEKLI